MAVVLLHTMHNNSYIISSVLYEVCGFAIPCFFMASGYVLLNREPATMSYCIKKICNILRVVLLWNLVICITKILYHVVRQDIEQICLASCVVEYIQNICKSLLQKGYLWHFWYLGALILLYLILPVTKHIHIQIKISPGTGLDAAPSRVPLPTGAASLICGRGPGTVLVPILDDTPQRPAELLYEYPH